VTTDTKQHTIDPAAAAEAQAKLTNSVGQPLTRESHDAELPSWKRWLKKASRA